MDDAQLAELAQYYEEYLFGDRKSPQTQQAKLLFKSAAKCLYDLQPDWIQSKFDVDGYAAAFLIPEALAYLEKRQTAHPTITPERVTPK
jgi:hypothetical protein